MENMEDRLRDKEDRIITQALRRRGKDWEEWEEIMFRDNCPSIS